MDKFFKKPFDYKILEKKSVLEDRYGFNAVSNNYANVFRKS